MSKEKSYLGVDIGAHGIKIVELKNTKNRPQLWTYGILEKKLDIHLQQTTEKNIDDLNKENDSKYLEEPKEDKKKAEAHHLNDLIMKDTRINEYAQMLKFILKKAKVQTTHASSSLPVSQVFHTVMNLPKVEEKMISSIVRSEIAKMIPYSVDDMQIIPQKITTTPDNGNISLIVTAAPKMLISFYSAIFQRAGLKLMELETEAFALARSLVGHDTTVSMVVDVGAERTNFFIIDNATPMTYRSLQIGGNDFDKILASSLGFSEDVANKIKLSLSVDNPHLSSDLFIQILDPIVKEIKYSFELYLKQNVNIGKRPEKIILTGGSSLFPIIKDYIASQFEMKVFIGNPWARVMHQDGINKILDNLGPRMSVAIGLALRNF
ncbi:MAG: hypothetical protein COY69_00895 [Candidatus Magasanikbacteria bacterium CG_4_10_14_0_8_um_filter_32_14]|uniref:SHS2 domain-containing protein n=2 Tax=Candidatus Magasanikiibacteriota TaxID=1752731 RepID=A0A2M7RAR4_9BACT|nr:MAG: hypothetical protein AUJ23_00115 [Candidatus Magasanikbacteria bacterium CG1_02_32_51]PIY93582.1 MAG: hypothetical protein COY69_00895 [Candidatus Magasanikbacteria bacterium CG_4_10_14_0_8_um_filter_32_14]